MALDSIAVINESVSAVTLTNTVQLGTRRSTGGVDYIYVYNGGGFQISQGQMGNIGAASMNSGFTVTVTNAASQVGAELVVGVAHNATFVTGQYGWLAVRGFVNAVPDTSAISNNSGDFLTVGVDGGFVSAAATISTSSRLGICLNSFTSLGTARILFKSPLFS